MIETRVRNMAPKSHARIAREKSSRDVSTPTPAFSKSRCVGITRVADEHFRLDAEMIACRETLRSATPSIMRSDFAEMKCVKERVYGWIE
jgi:hypothetical protein